MTPAQRSSTRWLWALLWLAVLAVGAWLRLWQIGIQFLLDDEWHAIHRFILVGWRDIALSFGLADYSIPLTLLFNGLYETLGISDRRMRLLPLAFGILTVLVVPAMLKPWLGRRERWMLALLLALSPLLIHFARYVRPYAFVVPLGFVAMVALWRWWHEQHTIWALVFVPLAVISAWLHPLTTLFTGAALTWFGLAGLAEWSRCGDSSRFGKLLLIGALTVGACAALLLPPLLVTPQAIAEKAGVHQVRFDTLLRSWELMVGSVRPAVALSMAVLVIVGGWQVARRDRWFLLYWCWLLAASVLVLMLLRPAWIHHALVLVRYTTIAQPVILALAAVGLVWLVDQAVSGRRQWRSPATVAAGALVAAGLYITGPLPQLYRGINQFTNAARYQADFDLERSMFGFMGEVPVPDFYRRIAAEPGDWKVIEAPWYFETNMNTAMEFQRVHQRQVVAGMVSGLCVDWTWGEVPPVDRERLVLRQHVFLTDVLSFPSATNRFVVFHLQRPFDHARELPDIGECVARFRQQHGQPWHESAEQVVFRLPSVPRR